MSKLIDLTGQTFGRLTVMNRAENNKWGVSYWFCLCECGNKIKIRGTALTSNLTKSCGCLKRERASEVHTVDITNQRFGRLVALERTNQKSDTSYKWKCQCDCGKIVFVKVGSLTSGVTQSCGCYNLDILRNQCGKNSPIYRHDLSDEERKLNKNRTLNLENKIWRKTIYEKDNYTCQQCFVKGGKLIAHHIHNWADYPDQRFDLDNGITLCYKCHRLFHHLYGNHNTTLAQLNEFRGS